MTTKLNARVNVPGKSNVKKDPEAWADFFKIT